MDSTLDELAGVVDLFGALTRDELADALLELAFKEGRDVDDAAVEETIERALSDYALVRVTRDGETLLVPGPTAFPALPENGTDLPHILDVERRSVPRELLGDAFEERVRGELDDADDARREFLLDVTYDAEAWAAVDGPALRERIEEGREA